MRKLERIDENPIDNILVDIAEHKSESYKKMGFTPNTLTTFSLILCILAIFSILGNCYYMGAILYFISYYYDCADGHYARKYKMTSKFGDYYDHISDVIKGILIFITINFVLVKKQASNTKLLIINAILLLIVNIMAIHFGCQEQIYSGDESKSIKFLTQCCKNNPEKMIKYTRYFGSGTLQSYITLIILTLNI